MAYEKKSWMKWLRGCLVFVSVLEMLLLEQALENRAACCASLPILTGSDIYLLIFRITAKQGLHTRPIIII